MAVLSSVIASQTVTLRAFQSTSFSFYIKFFDDRKRAIDITGATFRLVVRNAYYPYDNVIVKTPASADNTKGFIRFDLQASQLSLEPGEYPYTITMLSPQNYSSVVVKGVLHIVPNPDDYGAQRVYQEGKPVEGVEVFFRGQNIVAVTTAPMLPPNMNFFSDTEKAQLQDLIERVEALERK